MKSKMAHSWFLGIYVYLWNFNPLVKYIIRGTDYILCVKRALNVPELLIYSSSALVLHLKKIYYSDLVKVNGAARIRSQFLIMILLSRVSVLILQRTRYLL